MKSEQESKTRERLAVLETKQCDIMDKLDNILERFEEFEAKLDKALEKKANKWVETYTIWFLVFFATGVLGYIGSVLLKAMNHLQ